VQDILPLEKTIMSILIAGRALGLLALLVIVAGILYYMQQSYSGKMPKLRRLQAVDAIEEIIGRCVEMGAPAWYLMDNVQMTSPSVLAPTVAAFQILAYTARMAARLGAKFFVPVTQGLAYSIANDIVEEAYKAEGKPEEFDPFGTVMYLPSGADRMYIINNMWSQKVAGVFFLGSWYHKAVIFTENAADTTHNIPFLVAICDYSIIGEELYALGAYVSQDPTQTASLAGQDIGKYIALILILLGSILATVGFDISGIFAW
jgi:hypothetical protein